MNTYEITFEMHKNETVDGDLQVVIPTTFKPTRTEHTQEVRSGNQVRLVNLAIMPCFNFGPGSHVHRVALLDENPRFAKRVEGMSDEMNQALRDKAVLNAIKNKETNDLLRAKLRHYEAQGTLRVLSDSFAHEYEDANDASTPKDTNIA
jgi:hypothetical protein